MSRTTPGPATRKRHKKTLKLAEGFYGRRKNTFATASIAVEKALCNAYSGRKLRKRDFRSLWVARISAAAKLNNLSYNRFISGLKKAGVALDRKVLASIAVDDDAGFAKLCEVARGG